MLRNYLLVIFRNLLRNRVSSVVNIVGLAVGMAAFILIIQYVRYELGYDDFQVKQDRIFRVEQDRYNKGVITTQWAAGCSAVRGEKIQGKRDLHRRHLIFRDLLLPAGGHGPFHPAEEPAGNAHLGIHG